MSVSSRWAVILVATGLLILAMSLGWVTAAGAVVDDAILRLAEFGRTSEALGGLLGEAFTIRGLLGVILVSLICGVVSSLVVSNRMAFFSDALAHCAFAGVALGLIFYLVGLASEDDGILAIMVAFGVLVGLAIAWVREQTSLANDTVIGVFFAGAMGFGAVLLKVASKLGSRFSPENFLFGDVLGVFGRDLIYLLLLFLATVTFLYWFYNDLVFHSFNPSLARSRLLPTRLASYLLIVLLGLIVNLSLKIVGALLINALLILPAATASNLSRNLRQFFWLSTALSVLAGVGGFLLSTSSAWVPYLGRHAVSLPPGGLTVLIGVAAFFLSMGVSRRVRGPRPRMQSGA
jgi:zinc transport system permease protein